VVLKAGYLHDASSLSAAAATTSSTSFSSLFFGASRFASRVFFVFSLLSDLIKVLN
jgi:hypothetical protein